MFFVDVCSYYITKHYQSISRRYNYSYYRYVIILSNTPNGLKLIPPGLGKTKSETCIELRLSEMNARYTLPTRISIIKVHIPVLILKYCITCTYINI